MKTLLSKNYVSFVENLTILNCLDLYCRIAYFTFWCSYQLMYFVNVNFLFNHIEIRYCTIHIYIRYLICWKELLVCVCISRNSNLLYENGYSNRISCCWIWTSSSNRTLLQILWSVVCWYLLREIFR